MPSTGGELEKAHRTFGCTEALHKMTEEAAKVHGLVIDRHTPGDLYGLPSDEQHEGTGACTKQTYQHTQHDHQGVLLDS